MYVHSGKCRLCEVGLPTGLKDAGDADLFTGDIVAIIPPSGMLVDHFTVVVADQFKTYGGLETSYVKKDGEPVFFVMGIKTATIANDGSGWYVMRVKSYADVVPGERWPQYGFNYVAALAKDAPHA